MEYVQITSCSGWIFVQDDQAKTKYDVAAWALRSNGHVIGLVSVGPDPKDDNGICRLVEPPKGGFYQLKAL